MALPGSWTELLSRAADILGGAGTSDADEWFRQALEATYGSRENMTRHDRALAFQKAAGTLFALEEIADGGMLPFHVDPRGEVRAVFARFWGGVLLDGPPWRLAPRELDRLPANEISSDFDEMEATHG